MRRYADLVVASVAAVAICAAILALSPSGLLRAALALPLVLVLPGFALMAALRPGAGIDASARLAMTLGLSLAAAVLVGLILNASGIGFGARAWAIALGAVTLAGCALATGRRRALDGTLVSLARPSTTGVVFALAAVVAVAAVVASGDSAREQRRAASFTQLSILPSPDGAGSYVIEVTSREPEGQRYVLGVLVDGQAVAGARRTFRLARGETRRLRTPAFGVDADAHIEATLFRSEAPLWPYRRVSLGAGP